MAMWLFFIDYLNIMPPKPIGLFSAWEAEARAQKDNARHIGDVICYCTSRLRSALRVVTARIQMKDERADWMQEVFFMELVRIFCLPSQFKVSNCQDQEFTLSYIGMAAAIGQSVDIPILIRALACDIYRLGPTPELWKFSREFVLALDAGIDPDNPTAPVDHYHLAWWNAESRPYEDEILSSQTLSLCLANHKIVSDRMRHDRPVVPVLANPSSEWQRDISLRPEGLDIKCGHCRLYRAVGVTALDRLQDYRHHLHGLKSAQDARVDVTSRRAAGFFQLYEAALLKENTETVEESASSEQVADSAWSLLRLRSKSKGKKKITVTNVVDRVQEEARAELGRLSNRPDLKWTWGVDLMQGDVLQLLRPGGDSTIHSGYRRSLRQGRLGPGSSTSSWRDPGPRVGDDPPDLPFLQEEDWPLHFTVPPLRHWAPNPSTINPRPSGTPSPARTRPRPALHSEIQELRSVPGQDFRSGPRFPAETDAFTRLISKYPSGAARAAAAMDADSEGEDDSDIEMVMNHEVSGRIDLPPNSNNVAGHSQEYRSKAAAAAAAVANASDSDDLNIAAVPIPAQRRASAAAITAFLLAESDDDMQAADESQPAQSRPLGAALAAAALFAEESQDDRDSTGPSPYRFEAAAAAAAALGLASEDDSDGNVATSITSQTPHHPAAAVAAAAMFADKSEDEAHRIVHPKSRFAAAAAVAELWGESADESDADVPPSIPAQFPNRAAAAVAALLADSDDDLPYESSSYDSGDQVAFHPTTPGRFTAQDFEHVPLDWLEPDDNLASSGDQSGH
jgi:hypothetical protein